MADFNAADTAWLLSATCLVLMNTQIAGAAGALAWLAVEWKLHQRPSVLGIISGAVAGLVIVTVIERTIGLSVTREAEIEGLDLNLHGEVVQ